MIKKSLKEKYELSSKFFENAINENRLFHSFLLTGQNPYAQYAFALEIARILNCQNGGEENCECQNCRWIKKNSHPAVMTFSPIDFIHVNEKGEAKKNITVNQSRFIINELAKTSVYHRVLIFTNAKEGKEYEKEYNYMKENFDIVPPKKVSAENQEINEHIWINQHLDKTILTSETANMLLKTIEEPFENVTFFFLCKTEEDMLSTIKSRCQVVHINDIKHENLDFSILEKVIRNVPVKDNLTAVRLAEHLKELMAENNLTNIQLLSLIENYFYQALRENISDNQYRRNITEFLKKINTAKIQIKQYVDETSALENLFLL